ncbi:inositol-pentakisphosphate 2-kinase [[Candida] railenensis]|uniref:Inositol-pentakisphosphate 2-kinase n=1 Tax=[Candida] railenensis TaxID=45579 RepID=A0A9P0QSR1_9ASCO|nr:inositol-pentakisphosphate 2-kinase [[Candida] railenensis]
MEISKITSPSEWVYFAKGNANILFKYVGAHDYLKHKLLRVRLLKEEEEYISTCELYDFIELKCKPLFPKQIIDIQLVVLTTDFISKLNNNGHKVMVKERYGLLLPNILYGNYEKQFLSKHCQLYTGYSEVPHSLSETDASQTTSKQNPSAIDSVIFEIKPKWLYDNTSSNYCRTCSLNQYKNYKHHFCPLDFLYEDTLDQGLADFFSKFPPDHLNQIEVVNRIPVRKLFRYFLNNPDNVFQKLKEYQKINNKNDLIKNLGSPSDVSHNLSLVMTLRDVGLFIKFEKYNRYNNIHNSHNNINNIIEIEDYGKFLLTCNIYDLDLKSKMKYRHWFEVEQNLQSIYNSTNEEWRFCTRRNIKNNLGT